MKSLTTCQVKLCSLQMTCPNNVSTDEITILSQQNEEPFSDVDVDRESTKN